MKEIPHSIDSEKAVLGSILLDNRNIRLISDKLNKEDFYSNANSIIFKTMLEIDSHGDSIEPLILKEYLSNKDLLSKTGGLEYINSLLSYSISAKNIETYVRILSEKSILRDLINICSDISEDCFNSFDSAEIFDKAEKNLLDIIRKSSQQGFIPVKNIVNNVIEIIEKAYDNKQNIVGIPTGFIDLDRYTAGFQRSDLIILAARPAMGKTSLALNIATNSAIQYNIPVALFSLEMSKEQLVQRIIASEAEIDQDKLKRGNLSESDFSKLVMTAGKIFDAQLYINDSGFLSINELKAASRKVFIEHNIQMIVIDYLQLLSGSPNSKESRTQEIAEISRNLKALAKELNIPIIALSQLSRAVESRNDKRPMLSDLRESGSIEQDADMVMFLYRDSYYNPDSKEPNVTELIIGKHRNGSVGSLKLFFKKEHTKFKNLTIRP
ncbi:MAG: replicative DNA helicase [Candidatus Muirbacterium halophilum]|nr:replicative DNA helicase [Candidatus Muirbacterium halophilum]MCK9474717.1 replicative DNA helicase [Candidatus Muirbacterium halophilum]